MVRKTKQEALETRNRLLDAAEQVFLERGVSRTSLQDIASAAGVTRGAVYWHFKDKVELFHAMMDRATMPLEDDAEATISPAAESLVELRWGLMNALHLTQHDARTQRAFQIAMHRVEFAGELAALLDRKRFIHRDWRQRNRRCFEAAQAEGHIAAHIDVGNAALALIALVDGLLHQWMLTPEDFDLLRVGEPMIDGFLRSLLPAGHAPLPLLTAEERLRFGSRSVCGSPGLPNAQAD